jgi:hypothetical protein
LAWIGIGLVLGLILLRAVNIYGDPHPWHFDPGNIGAWVSAQSSISADDLGARRDYVYSPNACRVESVRRWHSTSRISI